MNQSQARGRPQYLGVNTNEIVFEVQENNIAKANLELKNYSSQPIIYKVLLHLIQIKGTNASNIIVRPSKGEIEANGIVQVEFMCHSMNASKNSLENEGFNAKFMILATENSSNVFFSSHSFRFEM